MKNKIILVLRIISAFILLQTLFFKFTGAPESKFIFSTLGVEPWGRYSSGAFELLASLLLLIPSTKILGALLGLGIMGGAILSHLFILGVVIKNDGGLLFGMAITVFMMCGAITFICHNELRKFYVRK